jgi:hypothetical protein
MAGVSQTRSIMYNKSTSWREHSDNDAKTYIKKAKQHAQEQHHSTNIEWWEETPLTPKQIEEIFWKKLVNKGWKLELQKQITGIVLLCPDCEEVVDRYIVIKAPQIAKIVEDKYIAAVIAIHNGKRCNPEVIEEA